MKIFLSIFFFRESSSSTPHIPAVLPLLFPCHLRAETSDRLSSIVPVVLSSDLGYICVYFSREEKWHESWLSHIKEFCTTLHSFMDEHWISYKRFCTTLHSYGLMDMDLICSIWRSGQTWTSWKQTGSSCGLLTKTFTHNIFSLKLKSHFSVTFFTKSVDIFTVNFHLD